jgi:penicillin-binding protein 1A
VGTGSNGHGPNGSRPVRRRRHNPVAVLVGRVASLLLIALLLVGLLGLAVGATANRIAGRVRDYTDVSIPKIPVGPQTTFVYDRDGRLITALHAEFNRIIVPLSKMSKNVRNAVIAIEDKDFYRHGGVDPKGIFRAAYENAIHGRIEQGGSTITQQFVKNVFTGDERTLGRKIHEAVLAVKLEHQYSKNQILEKYLNTVYFGHGAYGVQAAAETYFGTPASDLNVGRSALLAAVVAAPGRFDPVTHPEDALARRNAVLDAMARQHYITQAKADAIKAKRIRVPGLHREQRTPFPYFMQYVTKRLLSLKGYSSTFEGGLRVSTTIDPTMQRAAEAAVATHLPLKTDPSAALVAIDPSTGAIRALVGGRNFERTKFNLATQGHRQAGSAFKAFTLAAAMEQRISLSSLWQGPPELIIPDERCFDHQLNKPWDVSNSADESAGTMTLQNAIAHSVNTIFAQLVLDVTPEAVADVARRMGIRSKLEPVCSITLGTQAVTPLDMADAYATLAARGVHHAPQAIAEIRTAKGKVLYRMPAKGDQALAENDADLVTYALQGVVQFGTGTAANIGRPQAGKTGTGQEYRDAWFCGYVPQLATCVWVGYRQGEITMENVEGLLHVYGGTIPALIWHDFMLEALKDTPVVDFPTPSFVGYDKHPEHSIVLPPAPIFTTAPAPVPSPVPSPPPIPSPSPKPNPSPSPTPRPNPSPTIHPSPSPTGGNPSPTGIGAVRRAVLPPAVAVLGVALGRRRLGSRRSGHRRRSRG